ncbi:MAG: outer membrane lipoprotein carrier protein LolA [Bacteroidales bacterium]|nr:outer membrane lipoprotein carrier protein LolA [Bacteroidales bacterium]
MKKTILIIIGILLSIKVSAQSAEEFLNSVIEKNKSYEDISIIFNYRYGTKEEVSNKMKGYAYMKGEAYLLKIDGQEMISDGSTLWTYLIDEQEVMISDVNEDNNSPLAIINSFSENVNVSFEHCSDADLTHLLITEKEATTFKSISLYVKNKDLKIHEIDINNLDDSYLIYSIESFHTNQNLPDSMFIFDEKIHPNVEVIDMR